MNAILHHEGLQQLEATWRGLNYLIEQSACAADVTIRLLDVSKAELHRTLRRWPIDDSVNGGDALGHLYDDAYRVAGAAPFGCLLGDYWFDHTPHDCDLLSDLAALASLWQAPFFAGAAASLLNIDSWRQANSVDIAAKCADPAHRRWRSLRESDASRFIGLVMPNMLARPPFSAAPNSSDDHAFFEEITAESAYCWTNAVFALALKWIRAFDVYGWCGAGEDNHAPAGPQFAVHPFPSREAGIRGGCPLEVDLSNSSFENLRRQGLIPLVYHHTTGLPCWFAIPSLCKSSHYQTSEATTDAALGVQMRFMLSTTRFANYLTLLARRADGRLRERAEIEERLTRWIESYVHVPSASQEGLEPSALRPLAEARRLTLHVSPTSNYYTVDFMIRPQYLLPAKLFPVRLQVRLTAAVN